MAGNKSLAGMISGFGKHHSNKNGDHPYLRLLLDDIRKLVDDPPSVPKDKAQWLIPSTLDSRVHAEQAEHGEFWALWADVDWKAIVPKPMLAVFNFVVTVTASDVEVYSSKSATKDRQKCRVLIPLAEPLGGGDWILAQRALNEILEEVGIEPDSASEGAGQLLYLPNRGDWYEKHSHRKGVNFDPMSSWDDRIATLIQKDAEEASAVQAARDAAKKRRESLKDANVSGDSQSLIHAFNQAYSVEDILLQAGYDQRGNTFRHPNSETGSFSASVKDGRVHSLSSSDPLFTGGSGGGAHDAFSAFQTLFHQRVINDAMKDAGDNWLKIGIDSWNQVLRRKFAEDRNKESGGENPTQPEPLRAPMPPAEPYPVEMLGDVLGSSAQALHDVIKAPLALCCQSVLGSASLAAQAHFNALLPWGSSCPLSLFLLTVGESGERKSAVDDIVLGAAKAQEKADMQFYLEKLKDYEAASAAWNQSVEAAKKSVTGGKRKATTEEIRRAMDECGEKPIAPISPLRFVTDPTVEGLFKLLAIGQPSVALFSDEGGLLIGGHALNSDNALKTMARWCKLWDGSPFDRVRAGDGSGILYGRRMALHQLAQPEVMVKLLSDPTANGQGFLARCLTAWPSSTIGTRHTAAYSWAGDRPEVKRLFGKLKALMEAKPSVSDRDPQELKPIDLPLSPDAQALAVIAGNAFEDLMASGNDLAELRDRGSKALENACRIAGVLAVIEGGMAAREISRGHLERGVNLIQWYLNEALRIRSAAAVPQSVLDAESMLHWLKTRNCLAFRTASLLTHGPSQLRDKKRLDAAIDEAVKCGYLAEQDPGTEVDGVRAKRSWRVLHYVV